MFRSANAAHFALQIPAIRHDFQVLAFNGTEAISTLYTLHIELVSEHPDFDLERLLSQPAFLQFGYNGEGIHGRIEDVLVGEAGKATMGLLVIGFENPDPHATEDNRHFSLGFNCGGGTTAMALWECIRSYMEIGPEAVPDSRVGIAPYEETQIGSLLVDLRKGEVLSVLWGVFCITLLGTYLAEKLQDWKLSHPPDLPHPDIIEWSKPLPADDWAKRSPELEAAIAQREAELAEQALLMSRC